MDPKDSIIKRLSPIVVIQATIILLDIQTHLSLNKNCKD